MRNKPSAFRTKVPIPVELVKLHEASDRIRAQVWGKWRRDWFRDCGLEGSVRFHMLKDFEGVMLSWLRCMLFLGGGGSKIQRRDTRFRVMCRKRRQDS